MKVVHGWLQEHVDTELPEPEALAELLTRVGLEVEEIDRPGDSLAKLIVGEVLEAIPHPDSDHLSVCQVTDGRETHTVVFAALPTSGPG